MNKQIFELDYEQRMKSIQDGIENLKNIDDSLADKRDKYRKFAIDNNINFKSLEACCKSYETNILISVYTLSEQLVKNLYYELLHKDAQENLRLDKFLNKKLPQDKFSPNAKFDKIELDVNSDLASNFKFIYSKNNEEIKMYNDMIQRRHTYAHNGQFSSAELDYNVIIKVINYIYFEFLMLVNEDDNYRKTYQESMKHIKEKVNAINKNKARIEKKQDTIIEDLSALKQNCIYVMDNCKEYMIDVELLNDLYKAIETIATIDVNQLTDAIAIVVQNLDTINSSIF